LLLVTSLIKEVYNVVVCQNRNNFAFMFIADRQRNSMLVAEALKGVWRESLPDLSLSKDECARALPFLAMSGAGALAWWRLKQSPFTDSDLTQNAESFYRGAMVDALMYEHSLKRVLTKLKSIAIEPVMIKGWAAARAYHRPDLRPWGDIDLVVEPEDVHKAEAALADEERPIDLSHRDLRNDGLSYRFLMEHSRVISVGDIKVRLACAEDHLRFLCLHFLRHGGWRPLWLCDIGAAVESRPDDFDWERCLGSNLRRRRWVICAIGLALWLLDVERSGLPTEVNDAKLPTWLRNTILAQWDSPDPMRQPGFRYMRPIRESLRRPGDLFRALKLRWPDPLTSTIVLEGPLNDLPRFPFQIRHGLRRAMRFTREVFADKH
jgi:hypothetical protein